MELTEKFTIGKLKNEGELHRRLLFILDGGTMEGDEKPFFENAVSNDTPVHEYAHFMFDLFVVNERCIMLHHECTTELYDVTETFEECGKDFDKTAQAIFDAEENF